MPIIKRVTLLDGTPRGNSHLSFYSKFKLLDPKILDCSFITRFKNRYCVMGGFKGKEVVGEKNMQDFIRRTSPYCEVLEQDALDMPEKVHSILTVAMPEKTWKAYRTMRDELVAEIDEGRCTVSHAAVKTVRLAQLCSGFLGGIGEDNQIAEVHAAPTDMLMQWLAQRFEEQPDFKVVIWSRFVPEIERLDSRMDNQFPYVGSGLLYGSKKENQQMLHPINKHAGPFVLIAQPQAAQYGLNFSKADTAIYLSQDYNRVTRAQSEDRIQATGTRKTSHLIDVLVTGPQGQRTVTHDIIRSVREKEDAEKRTARDWKRILLEE
jgi:SNF2 family DNA or RNA helicase